MKLNKKGLEIYNIWEKKYREENNRLGGDYENGDIVEGWCIIDTQEHVKTLTDICGLLVLGYDDSAVYHMEEYIDMYGENEEYFTDHTGKAYTAAQVLQELSKYYETEE